MSKKLRLLGSIFAVLALLVAMATPAVAHHKDDHDGGRSASQTDGGKSGDRDGDADSDPNTAYNEDNDTNDGGTPNNRADEGDNRHPSGKDRSVENGGSGNQGKSESDPDDDGRGPDRTNGGPDKPNGTGGLDKADQDGNNGCGNDDDFEDDNEGLCRGRQKNNGGRNGGGTADMTIAASCFSVTVTSTKDISNVVIAFADGTSLKRDGLHGHTYTETFTKPIAAATAKSGTTVVSDSVTESCVQGGQSPCPDGTVMGDNGTCVEPGIITNPACPDGTVMNDNGDCVKGVLIQRPSLPNVESPRVLGERVSRAPAVQAQTEGAVLPFTGGQLAGFLVAGLALIATGLMALRVRRNDV